MELAEALLHANWSSSSEAAPSEESPMMMQLISTCSFTREPGHDPFFWSDHGVESSYCSYWPQECNNVPCNGDLLPPADLACYELGHTNMAAEIYTTSVHMGFCAMEEEANATSLPVAAISEETSCCEDIADSSPAHLAEPAILTSFMSSPKRKSHLHVQDADATAIPTKKLRATQRIGKNEQMKKTRKGAGNSDAGEINGGSNGQDSSSCSSQEESSSSQEVHGGGAKSSAASDLNGKARAGRSGATDPQTLYARKRRERINERLRILQNLVPNGTKVDISTMLEEAVQYVKFLQLQIKLLSSDDLWMYAPLAYNGMDIGLVLKDSSLQ